MRLTKLNSSKLVWVSIRKYNINWNKPSASLFQTKVKQFLKSYWQHCVVCEEFRIPGSLLRIDFVNFNNHVIVEASPESVHGQFNPFFHKTRSKYLSSIKRDYQKQQWAEKNGFKFVEIYETDELNREFFIKKYNVYL